MALPINTAIMAQPTNTPIVAQAIHNLHIRAQEMIDGDERLDPDRIQNIVTRIVQRHANPDLNTVFVAPITDAFYLNSPFMTRIIIEDHYNMPNWV